MPFLMVAAIIVLFVCAFLVGNRTAMNSWGATPHECRMDERALATYAITVSASVEQIEKTIQRRPNLALQKYGFVTSYFAFEPQVSRIVVRRYDDVRSPSSGTFIRNLLRHSFWFDTLTMLVARHELRAVKRQLEGKAGAFTKPPHFLMRIRRLVLRLPESLILSAMRFKTIRDVRTERK